MPKLAETLRLEKALVRSVGPILIWIDRQAGIVALAKAEFYLRATRIVHENLPDVPAWTVLLAPFQPEATEALPGLKKAHGVEGDVVD